MLRRPTLAALFLFGFVATAFTVGCPKQDDKKETAASDDKKKAGDDDDDSTKSKKKKKKGDDDGDDDSKKKTKKSDDDDDTTAADTASAPHNTGDAGPSGLPIPAACAPDAAGRLGAKPKLVASAGEPGVSLGIWGKSGQTPLSDLGITLHADGRCYVDYIHFSAPQPGAQWMGYDFPKNSIGATTGLSERGGKAFVGFRVTINEPQKVGGELHTDTFDRFYGYVAQEGQPYSCGAIPGDKTCAMYQSPLFLKTGSACTAAKGGGPIDPLAQLKISGGKTPGIAGVTIVPKIDAGVALGDAGLVSTTCNGATCGTFANLAKESEHVYVHVSAGKPVACDTAMGAPHVGDVWYFDDNAWKKR